MLVRSSIDVNTVHVYQRLLATRSYRRDVPFDGFFQYVVVPAAMTSFTAENQFDGWIKPIFFFLVRSNAVRPTMGLYMHFNGLCPLPGLLRIVLLRMLLDLPGSPYFVSKCPVFDLQQCVS